MTDRYVMRDQERLEDAFRTADQRYGWEIAVRFAPFTQPYTDWVYNADVRTGKEAWVGSVTDYLTEAPSRVLYDLAEYILPKALGEERAKPRTVTGWLNSDQAFAKNRHRWLARSAFGPSPITDRAVEQLREQGLWEFPRSVFPLEDLIVGTQQKLQVPARPARFARAVSVSQRIAMEAPEEVTRYVVYRGAVLALHATKESRGEAMDRYPLDQYLSARAWLREHGWGGVRF